MNRARWFFLACSSVAFVILCGLGVWQVQRLGEKNAQIAAIDQRIAAEPIDLAEVLARHDKGEDVEYVKVKASGRHLPVPDLRKIASFRGSAGYELIAPFLTSDNIVILVDRGTIPYDASDGTYSPASLAPATVTGILRAHDKGQGYFDGDNDAEGNQWIWWDIPAMLGAVPVPADATVSRLILQRLPDESQTLPPIISAPKAELRNNHLGYAITWFGLAAALLVVAIAFLLKRTDKK